MNEYTYCDDEVIPEEVIPSDYRKTKFEDFDRLNEDEILTFIIQQALNHGWKFFGYWNRNKFSQHMYFSVFGGEITVYYYDEGTQRVDVDHFTLDDLINDEQFMSAYYGFHYRSSCYILEVDDTGVEKRVMTYSFHEVCWRMQIREIQRTENKLKWLFASINEE